jgi:hypothetical protein
MSAFETDSKEKEDRDRLVNRVWQPDVAFKERGEQSKSKDENWN